MRTNTVRDQANGQFAPVEHADDYEVVSQYPLPERFHAVYRTNGKYALIPAGVGLIAAVIVYLAALNYDHDMLQAVALGVLLVFGGLYVGNTKVRNLTTSFASNPSVIASASEAGVDNETVAKQLTRFALRLENEDTASLGFNTRIFVNLTQPAAADRSNSLTKQQQSFGIMRRIKFKEPSTDTAS